MKSSNRPENQVKCARTTDLKKNGRGRLFGGKLNLFPPGCGPAQSIFARHAHPVYNNV